MTTTQTHTFAWYENGDHAHDRCRTSYTGGNGVTYTCTCPRHTEGPAVVRIPLNTKGFPVDAHPESSPDRGRMKTSPQVRQHHAGSDRPTRATEQRG